MICRFCPVPTRKISDEPSSATAMGTRMTRKIRNERMKMLSQDMFPPLYSNGAGFTPGVLEKSLVFTILAIEKNL